MRTLFCIVFVCTIVPNAWAQSLEPSRPNIFNPQISAGAVFLGGYTTRTHDEDPAAADVHAGLEGGLQLQEVDLVMRANVDPYLRLDLTLSGHPHEGAMEVGFEEAYISTLAIPDLTLRAGQFLVNFGKTNLRHVHARHFLGAPLPLVSLFGTDHLLGTGLSMDYLTPLPFFVELNLQAFKAHWGADAHAHGAPEAEIHSDALDLTYLGHLKTFFELGETTTLEMGGSVLTAEDESGHWNYSWGADMTLKWVPSERARYTSFEWNTEYMSVLGDDASRDGLYTSFRYQAAQQWWGQLRGAILGLANEGVEKRYRGEALLAFNPSERSSLRLQYGLEGSLDDEHQDPTASEHLHEELVHEVFLQLIVSIGAHPAHAY